MGVAGKPAAPLLPGSRLTSPFGASKPFDPARINDTDLKMLPNIERVTSLLHDVAAEEALPRFRALKEGEVRRKRAGDLVMVVDLAVEQQLERRLPALLPGDRKSTRLNSSHVAISYAVFCLKKKSE